MRILVNAELNREYLGKIEAGFPAVEVVQTVDRSQAKELVQQAEVLVIWQHFLQPELLDSPTLRWVHVLSAGVEELLLPPIKQGRMLLSNSRGIHGIPISEHVFGLMLSFSRQLHKYGKNQTAGKWQREPTTELRAKTLGVVGLGSIGREIARLGAAFGMRVLAVRRGPGGPQPEHVDRVLSMEGLDMVLRESDYLVLSVPLTPETKGLIGAKQLELMKPTAVLINIARGDIVDETALTAALESGVIAGAGLDVFQTEPLPPGSPLWRLANCIITPHSAALSPQYLARATDLFCRNLEAYLKGQPLPTLVDPTRGY